MKISIKILLILFFFSISSQSVQAQKVIKNFINKYDDLAVTHMKRYNIPASIILGVSIVESAAGNSSLAKVFNNYFGIKGKNIDSKKKLGYQSAYKEYLSDTASYEHFCNVLMRKSFYKKLKGDMNYKEWLNQMNKANYAEAKGEWVRKITATIAKYELYKYDYN